MRVMIGDFVCLFLLLHIKLIDIIIIGSQQCVHHETVNINLIDKFNLKLFSMLVLNVYTILNIYLDQSIRNGI